MILDMKGDQSQNISGVQRNCFKSTVNENNGVVSQRLRSTLSCT